MKKERLIRFFRIWMILLLGLFGGSYAFGFIPIGAKETFLGFLRPWSSNSPILLSVPIRNGSVLASETWTSPRIFIQNISVDSPVIFSTSQNLDVLNTDLLKGVVGYPGSVMPGEIGNVFLFGHSTLLPAHNQAYKVFNRLKELKSGDVISIHSDTRAYSYMVTKVELGQADDTKINLTSNRKVLTLSTCNVIGNKESRYIVEAEFVGSYPLAK